MAKLIHIQKLMLIIYMETINRISKFVVGLLGRALTYEEKIGINNFINNDVNVSPIDRNSVIYIANMAKKYYALLSKTPKYEIKSILGTSAFKKPYRASLSLDSRYAIFNNERTKLTWCISESLNDANNVANLLGGVRNINWIRMQTFVCRKFEATRATILIDELSAQSFIMPNGRKFHFLASTRDLQEYIPYLLGPELPINYIPDITLLHRSEIKSDYKFNDGYFRFNKPINMLNDITISIGNPGQLVAIPKHEYLSASVIAFDKYTMAININEPHNLIAHNGPPHTTLSDTWYSVFVDGFATNEPNNAIYENYINTYEHTDITIISDTQIMITFNENKASTPFGDPYSYINPPFTSVPVSQIQLIKIRLNYFRVIINFEIEYNG